MLKEEFCSSLHIYVWIYWQRIMKQHLNLFLCSSIGTLSSGVRLYIHHLNTSLVWSHLPWNPLSANSTKRSNTLKQFVGKLPMNRFESIWPFCGVSTLHWPSLLFLLRAKPLLIYWGTESVNLLHPLLTLVVTLSTTPHQARTSAFLFPVQSGVIFNTGWKFKRRRPKVP